MRAISRKNYKVGIGVITLTLVFSVSMWVSYAYGEQVAGSSESGSDSYVKLLYADLQASDLGSDSATPDRGSYWNRFKTAAQWVPTGTVTAADVVSGKTFYNSSRTPQTGTLPAIGKCPTQTYHDGYGAPVDQTTNCTDTITWTVPSDGITGTEKQDPTSGLIWSNLVVNDSTTHFSLISSTDLSWDSSGWYSGGKTASVMCSGMGNGWRLPYQKELLQAYVNGAAFNLTQTNNLFWSATENSSTFAWNVNLATAANGVNLKTVLQKVRCVR